MLQPQAIACTAQLQLLAALRPQSGRKKNEWIL